MRSACLLLTLAPLLSSCAQTYAFRFPDRAFPTRPGQKLVLVTQRGRTEVRGIQGSRDVVVSGWVHAVATSESAAQAQAQAVRVMETAHAGEKELRLEMAGIPPGAATLFDAQFLVPRDVALEVIDGPEDLVVEGVEAGVTIKDGAGDIFLSDVRGEVVIQDLDGNINYSDGRGPVRITDRRGVITIREVMGDLDITDREDDALIESVTGRVVLAKEAPGKVVINNLDGRLIIRKWPDNLQLPTINTIWEEGRQGPARPVPASGPPAGPAPRSPAGQEPKDGKAGRASPGRASAPPAATAPEPPPR